MDIAAGLSLVGFVLSVFGILQIILFFKIWAMTNDVKAIRDMMSRREMERKNKAYMKSIESKGGHSGRFSIGELVVSKADGTQWRVEEMDGINVRCKSSRGEIVFREDEIDKFPQKK